MDDDDRYLSEWTLTLETVSRPSNDARLLLIARARARENRPMTQGRYYFFVCPSRSLSTCLPRAHLTDRSIVEDRVHSTWKVHAEDTPVEKTDENSRARALACGILFHLSVKLSESGAR